MVKLKHQYGYTEGYMHLQLQLLISSSSSSSLDLHVECIDRVFSDVAWEESTSLRHYIFFFITRCHEV